MGEISTRVWLEEELWKALSRRAVAEGVTVRDLIPMLVSSGLGVAPAPAAPAPAPARVPAPAEAPPGEDGGPPEVALSQTYRCGVCGAEVRLTALSSHLGRHLKEQQAAEAERS